MQPKLDAASARELETEYDSGLAVRPHATWLRRALVLASVVFAIYHYITAGFGVPVDYWHMGIHLSGLFLLIFTSFPAFPRRGSYTIRPTRPWRLGNVPLHDWIFAVLGICAALFLGFSWDGLEIDLLGFEYTIPRQAMRQGNPTAPDIFFGTVLVVLVLEAARRTLGIVLPIIILVFMSYALFGPSMPLQILRHPGVNWQQFINNMYFPSEGIFGITLWVISTIVFHFVLFGVIAQRMGLGQFFIDNATIVAGRFAGGPAKVGIVSSAFFGTISGSSIANTVTTGALTIPNMKRLGYPAHFAGGVEAAASAGGQITPPIMGAAAFLMAEYLQVPYTTIVIAAIVPAAMHYIGVMVIVHFEAKRLGLAGLPRDEIPRLVTVWKEGWPTVVPLVVLIYILFSGYTPYMAAFWGITTALVVGVVSPRHRVRLVDLLNAFALGTKYALAVGAAGAAVGIVVGVINTTGIGFRLGFMVTNSALEMAEGVYAFLALLPFELFGVASIQLFLSLLLIALACILMGAGLPTTALYIMLVAVAQPALEQLGVPTLASHMFVLYYGVVSEITPPVCASAYAAAGIAGANPFRTGLNAFTLGIGKLMVPMVFVYAPAMLLVLPEHFTWGAFVHASLTCAAGIFAVGVTVSGYFLAPLNVAARVLLGVAGVLLVAPGTTSDLWAVALAAPALAQQALARRSPAAASQI